MDRERDSGSGILQSNRHLKERNDNLAHEQQSRYVLSGRHRKQRDQLRLHTAKEEEWIALRIRQADENQKLVQQQSNTRLLMQQRHHQEELALQFAGNQIQRVSF